MSRFDITDFIANPTVDKLEGADLRKADWKTIADHFEIPISRSLRKDRLKEVVIQGLISSELLSDEAVRLITSPGDLIENVVGSPFQLDTTETVSVEAKTLVDLER
ncbi:hypothetical protein Hamer_G001026 [Homarus americanus]|uniref:Uncharacterized protein n=1 Tax=Homarus americanus TaxID=6706 RepID=A0A8J5T2E2_HOMAM|nr:hypothetical protein Hamer_G001026 [Homarus americanus]